MAKQKKTEGEILFEEYLTQNALPFEYEPKIGLKCPDYLVKASQNLIVEVKDLALSDFDKQINKELRAYGKAQWSKSGSKEFYGRMRRKMNEAHDQLKNCAMHPCVIVLCRSNKSLTDHTDDNVMLHAIYGDEQIVFERDTTPRHDFATKNAFLGPKRHNVISAIAVVEKAKPYDELLSKPLAKLWRGDKYEDYSTEKFKEVVEARVKEIEQQYPLLGTQVSA